MATIKMNYLTWQEKVKNAQDYNDGIIELCVERNVIPFNEKRLFVDLYGLDAKPKATKRLDILCKYYENGYCYMDLKLLQ